MFAFSCFCKNRILFLFWENLVKPKLEQPDCFHRPCITTTVTSAYCCMLHHVKYTDLEEFSPFSIVWGCDGAGFLRMTVQSPTLSPFVLSLPTCRPPRFNCGFKTEMNNFLSSFFHPSINSEYSLATILFQPTKNSLAFGTLHNIPNPIPIVWLVVIIHSDH